MKKRTWYTENRKSVEPVTGPSNTIQGQTHTIPEMIARYTQGIPVTWDSRLKWAEQNDEFPITIGDLTDIDVAQDTIRRVKSALAKAKDKPEVEEEERLPSNKNEPGKKEEQTVDEEVNAEED